MQVISALAANYPASGIRAMFERAQRYDDVVMFTFGEPDFNTPDFIKQAAKQAIADNQTKYVSNAGLPSLREAIAERYATRWGRPIGPENVLVAVGAMEALLVAACAVINPGDDVLVPDPGYPNYLGQLRLLGANPVPVPIRAEAAFKIQAADVIDRITDKTSAIILNTPSNPLGSLIDAAELAAIVAEADRRGVVVISDEVYEEIIFDGRTHNSVGQLDTRFNHIVINSFSKSFAMTGWRCGWLIAHEDLVTKMALIKEGITSCVPPFVQLAGLAALQGPDEFTTQMRATFQQRRDAVVECAAATSGISLATPEGAFYAFLNVSASGLDAETFAHRLLDEQRVCLVPGTAFGAAGQGHVRMSYATNVDTIRLGFDRIQQFINAI